MSHTLPMPARPARFLNLALTIAVLCWGFNFVALKIAYREMAVPVMSLTRFLLTWGAMILVCLVRKESLRFPKEDVWRLLTLGFLANGVYMVLFLEGMARTSAAEGAIVVNTAPVFAILLAVVAGKEGFRWWTLVGALVALAGVCMVALGGAADLKGELLGDALILASAVLWAWCVILTRPLVERYTPYRVLTLSMAGAAVVIVPYGLRATVSAPWSHFSAATILSTAHVGLLAGAVGFSCFFAGVKDVGSTGAILYQYGVPLLATFFAWLLLGQGMGVLQFCGMLVVFVGVAVAWRSRESQATNDAMTVEG